MRKFASIVIGLSLVITIIISRNYNAHALSTCQSVIIPAYSYPNPTTFWDTAISYAPTVSTMIADPANGPGTVIDSNYTAIIQKTQTAGVKVLGYVTSSYASRYASDIKTEINTWSTFYGVNDIFIDEVTSDAGHIAYYQDLYTYIRTRNPNATVVFNPGTAMDEGYMAIGGIWNIFEGDMTTYQNFAVPTWVANYPPERFLNLVYGVPDDASMQTVLSISRQRNAGNVYITSDVLPNPWDVLPPYFDNEINLIRQACGTATPTVTPTLAPSAMPTNTPTPTPTPTADTIAPQVSITKPVNNSTVSRRTTVTITAMATDNVGVTSVKFAVNGSLLCTDTASPYSCNWTVPNARGVTYTLSATAFDAAGNSAVSTVTVISK